MSCGYLANRLDEWKHLHLKIKFIQEKVGEVGWQVV